jgi:hypothetical protein
MGPEHYVLSFYPRSVLYSTLCSSGHTCEIKGKGQVLFKNISLGTSRMSQLLLPQAVL